MNLSSLITDFLEYLELERNASQLTIRNYDHYLKRFVGFVHSTSSGLVGEIEAKDIDLSLIRKYRLFLSRFVDPQTGKPLKQVTQNFFLIAIRAFLRYLAGQNIKSLAFEKVELGINEQRSLKILDERQIHQLLDAPDTTKINGIRDKAILETIFSRGLKVSELVSLNRDTAHSDHWLEKYLNIRKDSFKPLFIRFQGKVIVENEGEAMRLTPRSIQRIVEKYVNKLAFPLKATPHTLRHQFTHPSGNK